MAWKRRFYGPFFNTVYWMVIASVSHFQFYARYTPRFTVYSIKIADFKAIDLTIAKFRFAHIESATAAE